MSDVESVVEASLVAQVEATRVEWLRAKEQVEGAIEILQTLGLVERVREREYRDAQADLDEYEARRAEREATGGDR